MVFKFVLRLKSLRDDFNRFKRDVQASFKNVKDELDGHLEGINQNTNEIQRTYEYVAELESKIDKLNERIDELQMLLSPELDESQFDVELSFREQEVFLVIYSSEVRIMAKDVARRLGLTEEMVQIYVYKLISKGIPILKEYKKGRMFFSLESKFKDLQARKNLLKIDETVSRQIFSDKIV